MFSLAALITSKTRLSVMRFFLSNPEKELGVRETARALKLNPMQARSELLRLQSVGILKSRPVANSVQYSLNAECEAVRPLQMLLEVSAHE